MFPNNRPLFLPLNPQTPQNSVANSTPQTTSPFKLKNLFIPLQKAQTDIKDFMRPAPTTAQLQEQMQQTLTPEYAQKLKSQIAMKSGAVPIPGTTDSYVDPNFVGALERVGGKIAKPIFEGFKDYTTKVLDRLVGKSEITKSELSGILNKIQKESGIIKPELEITNKAISKYGDKIPVADLAKDIHSELLPLKPYHNPNPGYENFTTDFLSGGKYGEITYESPIKTSAGQQHPGLGERPNYFSHVRYEDLPGVSMEGLSSESKIRMKDQVVKGGDTRRIMEVQSDLMQKNKLEAQFIKEESSISGTVLDDIEAYRDSDIRTSTEGALEYLKDKKVFNNNEERKNLIFLVKDGDEKTIDKVFNRTLDWHSKNTADLSDLGYKKLQQYQQDARSHLRTFREEIKRSAQDNKSKLQFPTGETAMKIEGLGETNSFYLPESFNTPISFTQLKKGLQVQDSGDDAWIITDVFGDGRFKAIPKHRYDSFDEARGEVAKKTYFERYSETHNISGKVDKTHFVYRLNETDIPKEAKKLGYEVKKVVDDKGEWWEINPMKAKDKPVGAFGKIPLFVALGGTVAGAGLKTGFEVGKTSKGYNVYTAPETTGTSDYNANNTIIIDDDISKAHAFAETGTSTEPYKEIGVTGDLGKYQAKPETLKNWSKSFLGKQVTNEEFLNSPELQELFYSGFRELLEPLNLTKDEIAIAWHRGFGLLDSIEPTPQQINSFLTNLRSKLNDEISKKYLQNFHIGLNKNSKIKLK